MKNLNLIKYNIYYYHIAKDYKFIKFWLSKYSDNKRMNYFLLRMECNLILFHNKLSKKATSC